jgi:hypothetical protein
MHEMPTMFCLRTSSFALLARRRTRSASKAAAVVVLVDCRCCESCRGKKPTARKKKTANEKKEVSLAAEKKYDRFFHSTEVEDPHLYFLDGHSRQ